MIKVMQISCYLNYLVGPYIGLLEAVISPEISVRRSDRILVIERDNIIIYGHFVYTIRHVNRKCKFNSNQIPNSDPS